MRISADAARFTNSGATAPEKDGIGPVHGPETDMDQLKQRFPNDYRSYLFAGLLLRLLQHLE